MARFSYTALKADGSKVNSYEDGPDSHTVAASLRAAGLTPVSVELAKPSGESFVQKKATHRAARGPRPKVHDIAIFARQLSTLLNAGVGLVNALEDIAEQIENPRLASIVEDVLFRVMGGSPLSSALREHPKTFPPLVCAMARAGEESGRLDAILSELATYMEKQVALRRKVRSAMTYPVVIMAFFLGAVAFLFLWLLPKFENMFATLKGELPIVTRYALAVSAFAQQWFPLLFLAAVAAVVGFMCAKRNDAFALAIDRFKLKVPVLGPLLLKVALVRFLETLATLQKSGVAILNSLEMAGNTVSNRHVAQVLEEAGRQVAQGSLLSRELGKNEVFPRMMIRMMSVGEETGRVEDLLYRTATYYEDEVDAGIQSLTSLIEPVVLLMMGVVVAFVVVSVYFPIFQMAGAVG